MVCWLSQPTCQMEMCGNSLLFLIPHITIPHLHVRKELYSFGIPAPVCLCQASRSVCIVDGETAWMEQFSLSGVGHYLREGGYVCAYVFLSVCQQDDSEKWWTNSCENCIAGWIPSPATNLTILVLIWIQEVLTVF